MILISIGLNLPLLFLSLVTILRTNILHQSCLSLLIFFHLLHPSPFSDSEIPTGTDDLLVVRVPGDIPHTSLVATQNLNMEYEQAVQTYKLPTLTISPVRRS